MILKKLLPSPSPSQRRWIKILFVFIGITFLGIGGALWRLSQGPLEISPGVISLFQKQIGTPFKFKKLELVFESWRHPLAISINHLSLGHPEDPYQLEAQQARITFKLLALLKKKVLPTSVTLIRPVIRIAKPPLENVSPQEETLEEEKTILEVLETSFLVPLHEGVLRKLRQLTIDEGTVFIGERQGDLSLSGLKTFLARDKEEIRGTIQFTLEKDHQVLPTTHTLSYHLETRHLHIKSNLEKFIPSDWLPLSQVTLQIPFSGTLDLSLPVSHPEKAQGFLQAKIGTGAVEIPGCFSGPLQVELGQIHLRKTENDLLLEEGMMKIKEGPFKLKGRLTLPPSVLGNLWTGDFQGVHIPLQLTGTLNDLKFQELAQIWPTSLAPLVRDWVLKNIGKGDVPEASIHVTGDLPLSPLSFSPQQVEGFILFKNATLKYIEEMPLIEDIEGKASFNQKEFDIKISQGSSAGLKIKEGKVLIKNLDEKDQEADIQLKIGGSIKDSLYLVNHKPLFYLEKIGGRLEDPQGSADTYLTFKFPVETTLTPNHLETTADSHLQQAGGQLFLKDQSYKIQKGDLHLTLQKGQLTLKGQAEVNETPTFLEWCQNFKKDTTLFKLKGDISPDKVLSLEETLGKEIEIQGKIPLQITYTCAPDLLPLIEIAASLKDNKISIPILQWIKPVGEEALLKGKIGLTSQYHLSYGEGDLTGAKTTVHFQGKLTKEGKEWESFSLDPFRLGEHDFKALFSGKASKSLLLAGKSLNIEPFWSRWNQAEEDSSFLDPYPLVSVTLDLDRIRFTDQDQLYQLKGTLGWQEKMWRSIKLSGQFNPPFETKQAPLSIEMTPAPGGEKLVIKSEDGGKLLRLLGITPDVRKGTFLLEGFRALPPQGGLRKDYEMKGHIHLKEFYVLNVGILAQLLSLALLTSILDLVAGKGIHFHEAQGQWSQKNHLLTLETFKASGVSLGLTCEGMVNQKNHELHLKGLLIPANILNTAISEIPLIGPLLSGGQGCLFGTSYTIQGTTQKPEISVNPLSTFTPGLISNLFQSSEKPTVSH